MRISLCFILFLTSFIFDPSIHAARNPPATPSYKLKASETVSFSNATKSAPKFKFPGKLYGMDMKPAGSSINLKCAAQGNPVPNITWYKNNKPGITRTFFKPSYGKWSVNLEELTKEDTGDYTCKVCNELGCIQHITALHIQERYPSKPFIKEGYPGNVTVFETETAKFECPPISDLEPFVLWSWSPSEINKPVELESDLKTDNPDILTLMNVTVAHEGWYECTALNSLGNDTARGYLTVKKKGDRLAVGGIERKIAISLSTIIMICICVFVFILISIAIIIAILKKLRREKQQNVQATMAMMAEQWAKVIKVEKSFEDDDSILPTVSIEKVRYTDLGNEVNASNLPSEYVLPVDTKWEVLKENLILGSVLGEGEFGKVVKAEYSGTAYSRMPNIVAVKMLKENHSDEDMVALVSEMEIMKKIGKHENVVNLLGCCTQDGPLYVIVEYASNGCLKDYLRKHQPYKKNVKQLTERDLVGFALQVAKGMEFLISRGCIHRDLAARNVLVAARALKVADFGLARDVRDALYYRKRAPGKLPVRWMAPESLAHNYYTAQSDVWSFGILTWEIMTFGCTPYRTVSVHVLYEYLKSGQRLDKPLGCREEIYALMLHCWTLTPEDRPQFSDLVINLQEILSKL